jgi:ribosome-binding factor A
MKPRRSVRKPSVLWSGAVGPGDGEDPRYDQPGRSRKRAPRKTLQLCGQVARTLEGVLAEQPDDLLRNLRVLRVDPAPKEARLLVTVGPLTAAAPCDPNAVMARLAAVTPRLRQEVAAAITRRKTPVLVFQLGLTAEPAP